MLTKVNRFNLHRHAEAIRSSLQKAAFVSMDFEMTGVLADESLRNSRLDNMETRYLKAKTNSSQLWPLQLGIAAFSQVSADGGKPLECIFGNADLQNALTFEVKRYSFNLWPSPQDAYAVLVEAPALKFLLSNQFDFNLAAYAGIGPNSSANIDTVSSEQISRIKSVCESIEHKLYKSTESRVEIEISTEKLSPHTTFWLQTELEDWLQSVDINCSLFVDSTSETLLSRRKSLKLTVQKTQHFDETVKNSKSKLSFTTQAMRSPYVSGMKKGSPLPTLAEVMSGINRTSAPLVFHNGWVDTMHVDFVEISM